MDLTSTQNKKPLKMDLCKCPLSLASLTMPSAFLGSASQAVANVIGAAMVEVEKKNSPE